MSTEQTTKATGACLCGGVQYSVDGPLSSVIYCHCTQCRKTTGHYFASTSCMREHLTISVDRGLRWYESSPEAKRGFCEHCGSSLFWSYKEAPSIAILAGSLDPEGGRQDRRSLGDTFFGHARASPRRRLSAASRSRISNRSQIVKRLDGLFSFCIR